MFLERKELPHKDPKTINEKIENFEVRQSDKSMHPYTCGNDSRHTPLSAKKDNGKMIFFCKDCDYTKSFL